MQVSPDFTKDKIRYDYFMKYVESVEQDITSKKVRNPSKLVKHKSKILATRIEDGRLSMYDDNNKYGNPSLFFFKVTPKDIMPSVWKFYNNQKVEVGDSHCPYGAALAKAGYTVTTFEEIHRLHDRNGNIVSITSTMPFKNNLIYLKE